ncbi:MAG: GDP-L-fucose synthase [Alphaproteobacteria bacterium]|nr:GDP-L-fucose synthase [Alphaproteobacteria bacterium]
MTSDWLQEPYSLTGKRVFVAGHGGLVGSAVVRRLQRENVQVLTAPRDLLDLRHAQQTLNWMRRQRPHVVIMAAAKVGGIQANIDQPADFIHDNLLIQSNVMHAACEMGVEKLVFLGSSCIYPKTAPQPMKEEILLHGPPEPTNAPYAMAKLAGISMAQSYRTQHNCDFISLIPCNLYGPHDRFDAIQSHVIPALMLRAHNARMLQQKELTIWGSGTPRRECLFSDDLADAIIFALKQYSSARPLNIGSNEDRSIADLARMIATTVGFQGILVFDPARPDGIARKLMDSSRIFAAGWRPRTSLQEGLAQTYAWFKGQVEQSLAA